MASFLDDIERELPRDFGTIIATEGERRVEARLTGSRRDGERPRATMQVVLYEGSNAVDATEGEVLLGELEPADHGREWTPAMHRAVATFNAAIQSNLARSAREESGLPQPHDLWPEISAVNSFVTWSKLGPVPPRPERFSEPSLAAAGRLHVLPKRLRKTLNLPPEAGPIVEAYELDGWSIVVCMPSRITPLGVGVPWLQRFNATFQKIPWVDYDGMSVYHNKFYAVWGDNRVTNATAVYSATFLP